MVIECRTEKNEEEQQNALTSDLCVWRICNEMKRVSHEETLCVRKLSWS